ncbi:hypothetical protein [Thiocystis violascens]|uniref:Beta-galactosidase n=1 Tax=Thiocystis violascens (strain ATCC 17096 / DSM 198 / 6111) TaxID=765911 RepID=I3YC82_THIV6|nr:hypothetical protein [Thiocystis violascens]AFL74600.1 hypothetical protein Thivi_2681 [Thiocystis violascens DSM 198]
MNIIARLALILFCLTMRPTFAGDRETPEIQRAEQPTPIVAAHYFGRHWPKNFLSAFRREHVLEDLKRLRADGFNTVIFLVSWGDFQPVIDPCCAWDERAFARLDFLLEEAARAGLKVILRVGYAWSFHPLAEPSHARIDRLVNDDSARAAYLAFADRLGREVRAHPQVIMTFMSWEDQWLRRIAPEAIPTFDDYLSLLPATARPSPGAPLPTPAGAGAALFNAYWDWLAMDRLHDPARPLLPNLSYEIRVDKDPSYATGEDGTQQLVGWLDHRALYRQRGSAPVTIYWAPYWGAENTGEHLSAHRSAELLTALLRETREFSGQREIFIDQFNVVDNTPGHENNAILAPEEIDGFLNEAICVMQQHGVIGYGYWTTRDYRESPLHNPSFGYGLEGWILTPAHSHPPSSELHNLPNGDLELELSSGDALEQTVTTAYGRLPAPDARPDRVCVEVDAAGVGALTISAGDPTQPSRLPFAPGTDRMQCADIVALPADERLTLRLLAEADTSLRLHGVWLFDHTQFGGLYDVDGKPGPLHASLVRLNREFGSGTPPSRCAP